MSRTIAEIQAGIVAAVNADPVIGTGGTSPLTSGSSVAVWQAWANNTATAQWALENLFDAHEAEVAGIIAAQLPHTLQWYAAMARAFQYGVTLPVGADVYAVAPPAGASVLIIAYAAVVEVLPFLRIKVAVSGGGVLGALSGPQLTAFTAYMNMVKDAGVPLQCTSGPADIFQPTMIIYYDPQAMGADGSLLATPGSTPVLDAVNAFLDALPFNGVFVFNAFVAAMQAVAGVAIADVVAAQACYAATAPVVISTATPPQYVPDAGYMALDEVWFAAHVTYIAY